MCRVVPPSYIIFITAGLRSPGSGELGVSLRQVTSCTFISVTTNFTYILFLFLYLRLLDYTSEGNLQNSLGRGLELLRYV